jgi:2-polyprenyl-6-hydroxyphenyl methylase/3-demethylubiquinone-9 3-methyltransferase
MENPARILQELGRVVSRDGHVFFSIPSSTNLMERVYFLFTGNSTRYISERRSAMWGHISWFTTDILESLLDRAGLRLVKRRGGYCWWKGHFWFKTESTLLGYNLMHHAVPVGKPETPSPEMKDHVR